jgi:arsenate reductase
MRKPRVLFLCTGNSARSQMAEAFLRQYAGDRYDVYSAGLEPKGINPFTVEVMSENGLDISQQRSKSVREYMGRMHFDYLVTVCAHAERNCPTTFLGFGTKLHWEFDDPAAFTGSRQETLARFRTVRDQIDARIQDWLAESDN